MQEQKDPMQVMHNRKVIHINRSRRFLSLSLLRDHLCFAYVNPGSLSRDATKRQQRSRKYGAMHAGVTKQHSAKRYFADEPL